MFSKANKQIPNNSNNPYIKMNFDMYTMERRLEMTTCAN
jgi:hypothetical protein